MNGTSTTDAAHHHSTPAAKSMHANYSKWDKLDREMAEEEQRELAERKKERVRMAADQAAQAAFATDPSAVANCQPTAEAVAAAAREKKMAVVVRAREEELEKERAVKAKIDAWVAKKEEEAAKAAEEKRAADAAEAKKLLEKYADFGLSESDIMEYKEMFNLVDSDGGGDIGRDEVIELMQMVGYECTEQEVDDPSTWQPRRTKNG